jgi:hypothetical protein
MMAANNSEVLVKALIMIFLPLLSTAKNLQHLRCGCVPVQRSTAITAWYLLVDVLSTTRLVDVLSTTNSSFLPGHAVV